MYLTKSTFVGANFENRKVRGSVDLKADGKPIKIKTSRISTIVEQVGYWRKANQIHKWFVDNVQDGVDECQETWVSTEDLTKLLNTVKNVLNDRALAPKLLPTQSGFFFGGYNYDDDYFKDLEDTVGIVEQCLEEGGDYYYHSSW